MQEQKYTLSCTAAPLLANESVKLAECYAQEHDWGKVKDVAVRNNLIQAKRISSLKRIVSELVSRLKTLSDREIDFLIKADYPAREYLLWIAVCRCYSFFGDFATEVVYQHFMSGKSSVTFDDYAVFFNAKAQWHTELSLLKDSTRGKLRQILFKILRECGILDKYKTIIPILPPRSFLSILRTVNDREIMYFPIHNLVRDK